jgi:hypothetical protein
LIAKIERKECISNKSGAHVNAEYICENRTLCSVVYYLGSLMNQKLCFILPYYLIDAARVRYVASVEAIIATKQENRAQHCSPGSEITVLYRQDQRVGKKMA